MIAPSWRAGQARTVPATRSTTVADGGATLDAFRSCAGLSHHDLWLRYIGLGGCSMPLELEALLYGALVTTPHDHDVLAHALNERLGDVGRRQRVPYAEERTDD